MTDLIAQQVQSATVAAIAAVANTLVRKPLQIAQSAQDIAQYTERLMEMMDGFIDYSQATLTELKTDLHLVNNPLAIECNTRRCAPWSTPW